MSVEQFTTSRDLWFWLFEVGKLDTLMNEGRFSQHSRADIEAMYDAATDIANRQFEGVAERLDAHEPTFDGTRVHVDDCLRPGLQAWIESGLHAAPFAASDGGLELPYAASQALQIPLNATAGSGSGYLFLTQAAAHMLSVVGSAEQKSRYLPRLISGEWFGTMMLSEPQAGSSLGDIRTRARKQADGSYHLKGSKMWISAGDHDLADNIIHMVLAKIEDENGQVVPGSRGISLFLVPKYQLNADGTPGEANGVRISGINHKMGNRGTVNTVPVLGDGTPCVGELLGTPGKGLAGMFHMMNEARIGVGMAAAQTGWFGYRYSLEYAKTRPQGRAAAEKDPTTPQLAIIEHTDVRRMLLAQKALTEGAMALCFYAAELVDRKALATSAEDIAAIEELLAILTPIVKTWPSVWGTHANYLAIQVLGGYGYTREYPLERLYRDNRLNEIHEGTTGIQGLDLLGRKVLHNNGAGLLALNREFQLTIKAAAAHPELGEFAESLAKAAQQLGAVTQKLAATAMQGQIESFLANSTTYLDLCGHTVVAWIWLRMAVAACEALPQAADVDTDFYRGKLRACQYFYRMELPKTRAQAELLTNLDDTCLLTTPDEL